MGLWARTGLDSSGLPRLPKLINTQISNTPSFRNVPCSKATPIKSSAQALSPKGKEKKPDFKNQFHYHLQKQDNTRQSEHMSTRGVQSHRNWVSQESLQKPPS